MGYQKLTSGINTTISSNSIFQLDLVASKNIFVEVSGDNGTSTIFDSAFNDLGGIPFGVPVELNPGSYLINANTNGSYRAISAYIPSYESYINLTPLTSGTHKATSWNNFYRLMLDSPGIAFITASGDNASADIYDENLNFVAHTTNKPLHLDPGNYIVLASYNGYRNGTLNVSIPDEIIANSSSYQMLHNNQPLDQGNYFQGSDAMELDIVHGLDGNDRFFGKGDGWSGNYEGDRFFGGNGIDTSIYQGLSTEYTISPTEFTTDPWLTNKQKVLGIKINDKVGYRDGVDYLRDVERLQFYDVKLALDIDGNAGKVAKILASVFGAAAVSNKQYAGIGLNLIDGGMSYETLAALAINAAGANTREAVVDLLWTNLTGSHPTADQAKPFVDMLAPDLSNVGTLGAIAADFAVTIGKVDLVGLSQTGLEYV